MKKAKWIILAFTVVIAFLALVFINNVAGQLRKAEQEKVKLWASAISQKAQLVSYTDAFFQEIEIEERNRWQLYVEAQQEFVRQPLGQEVGFCYTYIASNRTLPVIVTDNDTIITAPNTGDSLLDNTLRGTKLQGSLLQEYTADDPIHYHIWGMPFMLFYKESRIYADLRHMLESLNESFLSEITQNSVFVPVIITDSLQEYVIGSGNINEREFNSPDKLSNKLCEMESENAPIEIRLPNQCRAYVFYESTPLIKTLRWVPILYIFIAFVLVLVSYNLFRTARTMEQDRIWVGMAKETAHQLGTPISSLMAWSEYLQGKTLEEQYAVEIRKDISRLETITHRFSKIGSVPELKEADVSQAIRNAITYLQGRSSKKITFVTNLPDEPLIAPINAYLFEWVIENICKNAIDAMNGAGTFTVIATSDARNIYIDLADTGKGIPNSMQKKIFESGFTTKQRGWGLGLSLAKRIIEEYHSGRIFLKYSIPGQGSVFQIVLKKNIHH